MMKYQKLKEETPVLALTRNKQRNSYKTSEQEKEDRIDWRLHCNGISEKGLSVNHKVKIVNFPGGRSEKILQELDDIIEEKPGDLIVYAGTNDITKNVNLSTNVKKIFNKISKEPPSTSIAFSSINNRKDKKNIHKTLTDANARLKNFCMQKEISLIDNKGIKEFHLGKRKLHLNKKGNNTFTKNNIASYKQGRFVFFLYGLVNVNDCLSNILEKGNIWYEFQPAKYTQGLSQ